MYEERMVFVVCFFQYVDVVFIINFIMLIVDYDDILFIESIESSLVELESQWLKLMTLRCA